MDSELNKFGKLMIQEFCRNFFYTVQLCGECTSENRPISVIREKGYLRVDLRKKGEWLHVHMYPHRSEVIWY